MQNIMFAALSSVVYCMICPPGLQAEGLFYRNPGPAVSHSGGLLEDGVGVEVPFNRYAHRAQREGAGTVWCSCKSAFKNSPFFPLPFSSCCVVANSTNRSIHFSASLGKVLPVLAIRGQYNIWRLYCGVDWRFTVWNLHPQRHGALLQISACVFFFSSPQHTKKKHLFKMIIFLGEL